jgi:L-threonylcarbamoyladenylate synthase
MTKQQVAELRRCLSSGEVALFGADTVYGLACDPLSAPAVERLYALKRRAPTVPAAVMFFDLRAALDALAPSPRMAAALTALLPGAVTVLLANPEQRFPLACAGDPHTLGLRVPQLVAAAATLGELREPVLQSSANLSGGRDPRRLDDVDPAIRDGACVALDAGELPGVASTVVDLREFEVAERWHVVREGAVEREALERALSSISHERRPDA